MIIKLSRGGKFLSCSRYPDCDGALTMDGEEIKKDAPVGAAEFKKRPGGRCFLPSMSQTECLDEIGVSQVEPVVLRLRANRSR